MRLAVCHPSPGLRRSITEGLAAVGIEVENSPDDLLEWLQDNQPAGAILPPDHPAWPEVRQVLPDAALIGLIERDDPTDYARAFAADAVGVVATTWDIERIVHVIQDATEGFPPMPLDVARTLAANADGPPTSLVLSSTETKALRLLCAGATVVAIAERLCFSNREMHRILSSLYLRMGVTNRAEAIVRATQWKLLDT